MFCMDITPCSLMNGYIDQEDGDIIKLGVFFDERQQEAFDRDKLQQFFHYLCV